LYASTKGKAYKNRGARGKRAYPRRPITQTRLRRVWVNLGKESTSAKKSISETLYASTKGKAYKNRGEGGKRIYPRRPRLTHIRLRRVWVSLGKEATLPKNLTHLAKL